MNSPALKSITITDFRSIKGEVTVPLDAQVVLMYGQNGAGKTNILLALELALTGCVQSMRRFDPNYESHLIHQEADEGKLAVTVAGLDSTSQSTDIIVNRSGITGSSLLSEDQAHFYSERCYLAQATFSQLLEIYEQKGADSNESPLTTFVKDLFGLNHLDALITGLHEAGDKRRVRRAVPLYSEVEQRIKGLEKDIVDDQRAIEKLDDEIRSVTGRITDKKKGANLPDVGEEELKQLSQLHRNISSVRDEWLTISSPVDSVEYQKSERMLVNANAALKSWRLSVGTKLEDLFKNLGEFFPHLRSPGIVGPEPARAMGLSMLDEELERCTSILARDAEDLKAAARLDQEIAKTKEEYSMLGKNIAEHPTEAEALARALTGILPYIQVDNCPVCERDFSESSTKSLESYVSGRIATLIQNHEQVRALTRKRSDIRQALANAERQREDLSVRQLTAPER